MSTFTSFTKQYITDPEPFFKAQVGTYNAVSILSLVVLVVARMLQVAFIQPGFMGHMISTGFYRTLTILAVILLASSILQNNGKKLSPFAAVEKLGLALFPASLAHAVSLPFILLQMNAGSHLVGYGYLLELLGLAYLGFIMTDKKFRGALLLTTGYFLATRLLGGLF